MAFKMKHKLTSVGLKQKSTTPLLNIDPTDKDINKQKELSNYNEINRSVTTRRGMQNNMPGTFTDTNITERADFDTEIPVAKGGEQTTNVPEYIENLKKRFPGVPGSVLIEEGYIGPEFQDEFPLDYDQRDRLETTFAPDPALEEVNNYVGFVSGMGTASDFAAKGYSQNYDHTPGQRKSKNIIKRMRDNEAAGVMPVEKIYGQYNQGGSAGLVDADSRNRQAEQGTVLGIINREDFDLGQNFGMGYINSEYKAAIELARENFQTHKDKTLLAQEKAKALEKAKQQRDAAKSGTFATPEMQQRFERSHDTIYNRRQQTPPKFKGTRAQQAAQLRQWKGGGRTGAVKPGSITSVDTGYFDN
jgi:hypothetical protein